MATAAYVNFTVPTMVRIPRTLISPTDPQAKADCSYRQRRRGSIPNRTPVGSRAHRMARRRDGDAAADADAIRRATAR